MKRRIFAGVIASLAVVSVAWATQAHADGEAAHANATAMGQSLRAQLADASFSYEFALEQDGRLELTGHSDGITAQGAVAMAQSTAFGGGDSFCHLTFGDIEAALIVTEPATDLPQPCGVLGLAFDAAA
jgi:hypothetical protein